MDDAIANAMRRRQEISVELEEIDIFLRLHAKYSSETGVTFRARIGTPDNSAANDVLRPGQRRLSPPEIADFCAQLIREENRPLSRTELVELLRGRGIVLPSQDRSRYIGTILWRNRERFVNLAGRGYVLAESLSPAELESARRQERPDSDDEGEMDARTTHMLSSFVSAYIKSLDNDDRRRAHRDASVDTDIHPEIFNRLLMSVRHEKRGDLSDQEKAFVRARFIEYIRRMPIMTQERTRP